jgi:hypothetical protein
MRCPLNVRLFIAITFGAVVAIPVVSSGVPAERDPHRPPCVSARCKVIKAYLKTHYCGESPSGNGPDDGCDFKQPPKRRESPQVIADFKCDIQCAQRGKPPSAIRTQLLEELHRAGMPTSADSGVMFLVMQPAASGWSVAQATYSRVRGRNEWFCEVIAVIDKTSGLTVLRKVAYQRTDADVPTLTRWSVVDLADVDGDGNQDIVLMGDEYENHWLEVERFDGSSWQKVFSGLGYYL